MTVKRKSTGDLEEVSGSPFMKSYRALIIFLVLSMHPIGRVILGQMGFVLPDQAAEKKVSEEVQQLKGDVAEVKKEVTSIKDDVERITQVVTGFQVDFERYKTNK